jgi:hypothetical protein
MTVHVSLRANDQARENRRVKTGAWKQACENQRVDECFKGVNE